MEKRWVYKDLGDPEIVNRLALELSIDTVLASLLVQRGVKTYDEAKRFFRPSLDDLYDPFLMKDMHNAVDRIEQAIRKGERILFYGDYDVDGTTAVALMYSFFRSRYSKIGYYIPDRYNEGYGISLKGIEEILRNIEEGQPDIDRLSEDVKKAAELIKICRRRLRETPPQDPGPPAVVAVPEAPTRRGRPPRDRDSADARRK